MVYLSPVIGRRQRNHFVDLLSIEIMTDSNLKKEDRTAALNALNRMRESDGTAAPAREFDRAKFEELRKRMGSRKGRAPQRVQ